MPSCMDCKHNPCKCDELKTDNIKPIPPRQFWLIYYECSDGTDRMGCNITIAQSPASWLAKHRKSFPDDLVMLKFAMPITEEECNNL